MARLITTVGGAYSNSYVTLGEADLIASNFPWYDTWIGATEDERTQALIQAAFAMQQLPWDGEKCAPAVDAGKEAQNWDQYGLRWNSRAGGIFKFTDDDGYAEGISQGDESIKYGRDGSTLFANTTQIRLTDTEGQGIKFWDASDTELIPTSSTSSAVGNSTITFQRTFNWDTPVDIAYLTAEYNELINPFAVATWRWGFYVNGEQLLNFPGTKTNQAQRLAWPRSGVTCDGEVADCSFIPETIKITQVIIAYNFLTNPDQVPGTPGSGAGTPTGTYIKRQKIDVLEIEYDQYTSNQFNLDCNDCDDPYLIQIYPWLRDLLSCWLTTDGTSKNRLIRLFRN